MALTVQLEPDTLTVQLEPQNYLKGGKSMNKLQLRFMAAVLRMLINIRNNVPQEMGHRDVREAYEVLKDIINYKEDKS